MVKVVQVTDDDIRFDDGTVLESDHDQDCCEHHYLSFKDLSLQDFEGLDFDISGDTFFERVPDYGIRLLPVNGQSISVPGYGYNNGYYSHNLSLVLRKERESRTYDISDCQDVKD